MSGYYSKALTTLHPSQSDLSQQLWDELYQYQISDPIRLRHCEFLAIALLQRSDHCHDLNPLVRQRLQQTSQPHWSRRHSSMNFNLMRIVVEVRLKGQFVTIEDLNKIGLRQSADGALPDGVEGVSSQYHAYMLLLLVRWGDRRDENIRRLILNAYNWLLVKYQSFGDPNPIGRGRFQIFGYAALAALVTYLQNWGIAPQDEYMLCIFDRLVAERPSGALSDAWSGPFRDALLHGYNTEHDYAAFAKFWVEDKRTGTQHSPKSLPLLQHALDNNGATLFANEMGAVAALTPPFCLSPTDLGRKREIKTGIRQVMRSPRCAENILPKLVDGSKFRCGDADVQVVENLVKIETDRECPIIWLRRKERALSVVGCAEQATLMWSRDGMDPWWGYTFRPIGRIQVLCPLN